jgi:hypothetical protein
MVVEKRSLKTRWDEWWSLHLPLQIWLISLLAISAVAQLTWGGYSCSRAADNYLTKTELGYAATAQEYAKERTLKVLQVLALSSDFRRAGLYITLGDKDTDKRYALRFWDDHPSWQAISVLKPGDEVTIDSEVFIKKKPYGGSVETYLRLERVVAVDPKPFSRRLGELPRY